MSYILSVILGVVVGYHLELFTLQTAIACSVGNIGGYFYAKLEAL